MADYPMEKFENKTALDYAKTPYFDQLAKKGTLGLVQTIPADLPPGSDTANLSVLGYDPLQYYTGRSPFEAASLGIDLKPEDIGVQPLASMKEALSRLLGQGVRAVPVLDGSNRIIGEVRLPDIEELNQAVL